MGRRTHRSLPPLAALLAWALLLSPARAAPIRNLILFIGDGMGPDQVKAARCYAGAGLCFERFPYQSSLTTRSADSAVTDSAAAATAMATGTKVNNGVISLALPGDGRELKTLLECFQAKGKAGGLVTTTPMTHATPAAFGAHATNRDAAAEIALDYMTQTRPNVLFGGGGSGMTPSLAASSGYSLVTNRAQLLALDTESATRVSGQFGQTALPFELDGLGALPHLSDMADAALRILDNDPDGFFLMVEGGLIDHACHQHDLPRSIAETIEFGRAVQKALDWAAGRSDTLILVTADHETGGLSVTADNGPGNYPTVTWSEAGHSARSIPLYAQGIHASLATNTVDNSGIFNRLIPLE